MLTGTAQGDQHEPVRATVRAGTTRMDYWRAGRGAPVLLLPAFGSTLAQHARWVNALASSFRVLAPSLASTEAEARLPLATRLRSFLDGLGVERIAVVAGEDVAAEVLWLALSEPERIARIVIVLSARSDPACPEGLPPDRLAQSRQPILVVRTSSPDSGVTSAASFREHIRMLRFLSGDG